MSLLVVGASGFVGRNFLLSLPEDTEVTALYNKSSEFPEFLRVNGLANVRPLRADLTCVADVQAIAEVRDHHDRCLYLAANGDPAESVRRPAFDLQSNCVGFVNLVEAMSFDTMIFVSSGAVYDGHSGAVSPRTSTQPTLPYAISKLAAEGYLHHFQDRGRIHSGVAVRFFGAFGPHEPPRKVFSRLVRQFGILREASFTLRGDGNNLIDAMYVSDAVRALTLLLASPWPHGTVDLYAGKPITLTRLVHRAAAAFGVEPIVSHEGNVPEHIDFHSDDPTMADRFAFSPAVSLEAGLRNLHAHLAPHG